MSKKPSPIDKLLELATALELGDEVTPSTMMGYPCLRVSGKFFASVTPQGASLIVKLPAARVLESIDAGHGVPFAPNGKVFREWLELPKAQSRRWKRYLREAHEFVQG